MTTGGGTKERRSERSEAVELAVDQSGERCLCDVGQHLLPLVATREVDVRAIQCEIDDVVRGDFADGADLHRSCPREDGRETGGIDLDDSVDRESRVLG